MMFISPSMNHLVHAKPFESSINFENGLVHRMPLYSSAVFQNQSVSCVDRLTSSFQSVIPWLFM